MKKQLLCFVMFLSAFALFAQPVIKFDSTTIDFGSIKEEGGKASGKFEFTNTGDQDLLLTSVKPGCGCTAADYTRTPIAPGGRGFITATYDPYNRPGGFNKNIKVTTNEERFTDGSNASPHSIFIKGNVEKRAPSKFEIAGYKTGTGNIRIKENNLKLEILHNESKSFTIQVMNFSENESTFEPIGLPDFIIMDKIRPIQAGEEKEITFRYDAVKRGEMGSHRDIINIKTEDPAEPRISLFIDVMIKEDFSQLTPKQLQDVPRVRLDSLTINFGKVGKNENPVLEIKLYNDGKNPLIIRQLKSSNSTFTVVSDKNEISKGGFATLTVTLVSKNKKGKQNAIVEIITNDPTNSHLIINATGEVLQ
ncbi:MAG: DUF1573 domain-containing protein [Lentimicrobiaceae bacterium]|nr:DUF1573 domain-containing protein [Lentimicrobiaceae bacterium]